MIFNNQTRDGAFEKEVSGTLTTARNYAARGPKAAVSVVAAGSKSVLKRPRAYRRVKQAHPSLGKRVRRKAFECVFCSRYPLSPAFASVMVAPAWATPDESCATTGSFS